MKRVLKNRTILAITVLLLMANGIYSQILTNYKNVNEISYQTAGKAFQLYVRPDLVYSPSYDSVNNTGINVNARWTWTYPAGLTGIPATLVAADTNLIEFTNPAVGGPYTVNVVESNSTIGCVDITPISLVVQIIAAPTGTMSINPGGTWQTITANQSYQICNSQAAQTVTVAFNENVPNVFGSYAFQVTETKELIDGLGTVISTSQAESVVQNFPLNGKLKGTNLGSLPSAAFTTITPAFTFTFLTDALAVLQNAGVDFRTKYTYRVRRAGAAVSVNNDFLSNISHKSDYLAGAGNEVYYAFTNNAVSFIVNPTPTTGPIYHIPNNLAY